MFFGFILWCSLILYFLTLVIVVVIFRGRFCDIGVCYVGIIVIIFLGFLLCFFILLLMLEKEINWVDMILLLFYR